MRRLTKVLLAVGVLLLPAAAVAQEINLPFCFEIPKEGLNNSDDCSLLFQGITTDFKLIRVDVCTDKSWGLMIVDGEVTPAKGCVLMMGGFYVIEPDALSKIGQPVRK